MVPRPVLEWFSPDERPDDLLGRVATHRQSYYPVLASDGETVLGLAWGWEILTAVARGEDVLVGELAGEPILVPETAPILDVLEALREESADAAVVVDEHGATAGMISREAVLRAIGGRTALTVSTLDDPGWQAHTDGSIVGDGLVPLIDLRQALGLGEPLPEEARYGSVGGFMMARLQKMPEIGDAFEAHGFRFEVVALDHYRISRFRAVPLAPPDRL